MSQASFATAIVRSRRFYNLFSVWIFSHSGKRKKVNSKLQTNRREKVRCALLRWRVLCLSSGFILVIMQNVRMYIFARFPLQFQFAKKEFHIFKQHQRDRRTISICICAVLSTEGDANHSRRIFQKLPSIQDAYTFYAKELEYIFFPKQ